jgi:hypothetical protein
VVAATDEKPLEPGRDLERFRDRAARFASSRPLVLLFVFNHGHDRFDL